MSKYDEYIKEMKQKYNVGSEAKTYMEVIFALKQNGMTQDELNRLADIWVEQNER